METKLVKINETFACNNQLPRYIRAVELKETARALYLYGTGTLETVKQGVCCQCGRTLTHPVSVKLGIGPECGSHWHDASFAGTDIETLCKQMTEKLENFTVDQWFPKSCVKDEGPADKPVNVPADHKMLNGTADKKEETVVKKKFAELITDNTIEIRFPFNWETVNRVKADIKGRKFNPQAKNWTCYYSVENATTLQNMGFELCSTLQSKISSGQKTRLDKVQEDEVQAVDVSMKLKLFPYQQKGVGFLQARGGRALLADEMGLGKTIQALAYLALNATKRPALVVCPASLKFNWFKEVQKTMHTDERVMICEGTKPTMPQLAQLQGSTLVIINYDILGAWLETLQQVEFKVMVTDEAHYFKNNSAKRTKAVKRLAKGIPHFIALTGTPIVNRPVEFFNALKIIDPQVVGNFWGYAKRYCGAKHNGYGWDFTGASNTQELHEKLNGRIMYRRLKKDVLKDLPDKLYSSIPLQLDNEKEYRFAERNLIAYLAEQKGREAAQRASAAEQLAEINTLRQLAVKGKLNQAVDWIRNFLEVDGKLVVFATHKFTIDRLMQEFGQCAVKVDGSVSQKDRNTAVEQFQNNPKVRLFVGNIQAAGVGLTLTAASNVAFLELPWTPGELQQAEDRCHRIGQKNAVNVHYLLSQNTIEEKLAEMLDKKRAVLDSVLDGKQTAQESMLTELINKMKEDL